MTDFSNIHNHTEYSLLDGKSKIKDACCKAVELGQKSLGIMDHGNCFGHPDFNKECKKHDLNPIMGCEFYHTPFYVDPETGKKNRTNYHLGVIAMDEVGLQSIYKLSALAAENYYYKPRISTEDLIANSEGLIVLSGCYASFIVQKLLAGEEQEAEDFLCLLKSEFPGRFYVEIQDSGVPRQPEMNAKLRDLASKHQLECVVTNDSHYVEQTDAFDHSVLLAINTSSKMSDKPTYEGGKRFAFSTDEYYMKSAKQLQEENLWKNREIEVSTEIAARCNVSIKKSIKIPAYPFLESGQSSLGMLRQLCNNGWTRLGINDKANVEAYKSRIYKELADIENGNLADYFLIVQHYIKWARDTGIPVGPGRGSAAGSLVSYLLGITTIDPIKYGLYWERFWNAGRAGVGMPDIDTDFSQAKRQDVLKYIKETFGEDRVLPVISFGRMMIKGVLKDVGRTFSLDVDTMNDITKCVPTPRSQGRDQTMAEALEDSKSLKQWAEKYPKLFKVAEALQNTCRHTSIHPSAVVVLDKPYQEGTIPIQWDTRSKSIITGLDFHALDDLGYLKLDVLGLSNLDRIDMAKKLIYERHKF